MVSFRSSAIVNRVRNVYRDNTKDSALESLRLQSVSISNIRDLSVGFSSSESSDFDLESSHSSLHFNSRKRVNERRVIRSRSQSLESIALQRNNTFSQNDKRLHYDNGSQYNGLEYETEDKVEDEYESVIGSEDEYRTASGTQEDISPLDLLMNFTNDDNDNMGKTKYSEKTLTVSGKSSAKSKFGNSDDLSINTPLSNLLLLDPQVNENRSKLKSKPKNNVKRTLKRLNSVDTTNINGVNTANVDEVNYIQNKRLRLSFEPKLSVVDDYSYVPSRVLINKSPFIIGSDASCDLVLPKKHFKFIAPKHVKFFLEHSDTEQFNNQLNDNEFRVRIARCATSSALYLNNNFLRGSSYIEGGDVICLGPRNNFLAFKFHFQENNLNTQNHSDDRIVISDDIDLMDVKIFVFQLPRINTPRSGFNSGRSGTNTFRSNYTSDEEWNEHNKTPSRRHFNQTNNYSSNSFNSSVDNVNSGNVEKSDYYRLKSPVRKCNIIEEEVKDNVDAECNVDLDSRETEPFLEFYSSGNQDNTIEDFDEFDLNNDKLNLNDDEIDLNDKHTPNSKSSPRNDQYKLIGIIDCWNNMTISEILPDLNETMSKNVDGYIDGKYSLIANNKELTDKESELKVYQLELLNCEIPEIKEALYNYSTFKEDENSLENIIKNNLCKILFVNLN